MSKGKVRHWICLLASYLFYGWWDWRFLLLIIFVTVFNWLVANGIDTSESEHRKKRLLWLSVGCCLGVLGVFKYFGFFAESLEPLLLSIGLSSSEFFKQIVLPVGISFFTFQTMSYTIDVYRGDLKPENSLLKFATYVAFFPQLVAGPIVRARDFLPQLDVDQPLLWKNFLRGSMLVLWGYFLKCGVADSLAMVVDERFNNPARFSEMDMAFSVVFYAFQIYGDFAGYSFIAIGIAWVLGFDFGANFDRPYFATSFSDFWRRWHISLSTWLRDYLYIPLGGNRLGSWKTYRNLCLTMLLGGLWHGASWTFVVWGGLHGLYLVVQRLCDTGKRKSEKISILQLITTPLKIAFVFLAVCVAWVFFRASSFADAATILTKVADVPNYSFASVVTKFNVAKGLLLVLIVYTIEAASFYLPLNDFLEGKRHTAWLIPMAVFLLAMICLFGTFGSNNFIYFQF